MAEPISTTAIIIGSGLIAGAGLYSAQKRASAARQAAKAARDQANAIRESSQAQVAQMIKQQEQSALQFQTNLAETKRRTSLSITQASQAQQAAIKQINEQRASSRLAIQQSNLQASIQRQMQAANVGRKSRKRVGTPRALRTNVEGPNALGLAAAGGATTTSGTGGLNV